MSKYPRYEELDQALPAQGWLRWLGNWNVNVFFLCLFAYQLLVRFQGIDFNDEGFHVSFYQQIFDDPESVQFGFWMWFTGIIGGLVMKLTPFLGLWGIRLAGAVVVTLTAMFAYKLLKNYLQPGLLKVSIIMLALFGHGDAKNIYYNNFSALIYFVVAYLLFRGIKENRKALLFAAGFFVCLNIFTRIANLTGIALALAIFYYGFLNKRSFKAQLGQLGLFVAGFVFSAILVYGSMVYLGHLNYFLESVKMVFMSSQDAKQGDGIGGAYGIIRLLTRNLMEYAVSLRAVVLIAVLVAATGIINYFAAQWSRLVRGAVRIGNYVLVLALLAAALTGWFDHYRLLLFFTGVSLLSVLVLFDKYSQPDFKLLVFTGDLIALIHPFGSSEGITTVEMYSLWIAFPVAIDTISKLNFARFDARLGTAKKEYRFSAGLLQSHFRASGTLCLGIIALGALYNIVCFPYLCDMHKRQEMTYFVNNRHMRGIATSRGRAEVLDQLLAASAHYAKPGDYVLAYDCMPMYHYMTETRSYVRNPCIWFYSTSLFEKELAYAYAHKNKLPVVVRQNIMTTGAGNGWPETRPAEDYALLPRNQGKNRLMNDFLSKNNYRQVWTNQAFTIFIPGENQINTK